MSETPSSEVTISTKLQRIAKLAHDAPELAFTTLAHHLDLAWMREAFHRTRKDGATGVDGQSAAQFEANYLGQIRTGAASGYATDVLAAPEASTLAIIGSGPDGLAGLAVNAKDRLAVRDIHRDAEQGLDIAVEGIEIAHEGIDQILLSPPVLD